MRTKKPLFFLALVLGIGVSQCFGQQTLAASGGDFANSDGSVAYSVGQLFHTTSIGPNGSIAHGVEQPYEISEILSSEDFLEISKDLKVSPNPSTDVLTLSMKHESGLQFGYQIVDINGKIVKKGAIISNSTSIAVDYLPSSTYFLRVTNNQKEVKVFKIIKK